MKNIRHRSIKPCDCEFCGKTLSNKQQMAILAALMALVAVATYSFRFFI